VPVGSQAERGMAPSTLTSSSYSHVVNVPIECVDLAGWLTNLTNSEYRRCCPGAHVAAGVSPTVGGERISIHVEILGDFLLVHQYIAELNSRCRCRMASVSDVFTTAGRTAIYVLWELGVEPFDASSCEYVNHLSAIATDDLSAFITAHGIGFEEAAAAYAEAFEAHNALETASFAASIERRARAVGQA